MVDGDTLDAIIDLGFGITKKERIRIAAIDAPETRTRNLHEKSWVLKQKLGLKSMLNIVITLLLKLKKKVNTVAFWVGYTQMNLVFL